MAPLQARAAPAPGGLRDPGRWPWPAAAPAPGGGTASGRPRRVLVLGICCTSIFLVGLDSTALMVALPSIGQDLHIPVPGLQWAVDIYLLILASMQIAAGANADRFGRRRVFQAGLGLFAAGSLLCSLATGLGPLLAARAVQAAGGAMLNPAAMSLITVTFTARAERARAVSIWHAVFGVSMACGPLLGGQLVAAAGWQAIFWLNIPIALAAAGLAARFIPESRSDRPRRPDPAGQALVIIMLGSLTYAIIEGQAAGWSSPVIIALFTISATALAALIAWEPRRAEPMIDLRLFRSLQFSGAIAAATGTFAILGGFLFLSTLYLQDARGYTPAAAGLHVAPMAAAVAICAPLAGRLVARRKTRAAMLAAGSALTVSCAALATVTAAVPALYLLAVYAVLGAGVGMANEPITYAAVSGLPPAQAGLAGGINSSSRMVGQVLGVAIAGPVLMAHLHGPMRSGFTAASYTAWCVLAGTGYAVLLVGILATGGLAAATAARAAALFTAGPAPRPPRPAGRHARPRRPPPWRRAGRGIRTTRTPLTAKGGRQ
jgi:EmrB/QacA subfamily drug resistance transporter